LPGWHGSEVVSEFEFQQWVERERSVDFMEMERTNRVYRTVCANVFADERRREHKYRLI
jgi:hypothetical protein